MHQPGDALLSTRTGDVARAMHVDGSIGYAALLHIGRHGVDDALRTRDRGGDCRGFANVSRNRDHPTDTKRSGQSINPVRVAHRNAECRALANEPLDDTTAQKARATKDGY